MYEPVTLAKLKDAAAGLICTPNGFIIGSNESSLWDEVHVQQVETCRRLLRFEQEHDTKLFRIGRSWSHTSSYGFKHNVEYLLKAVSPGTDYYIANGSFIMAAFFQGMAIKIITNSPNAVFKRYC